MSADVPNPRPPGKRHVKARERIFVTALPIFLRDGFDRTTVDDIAAASEVPRRSVFRYFPTKEDIVLGWALQSSASIIDHLPTALLAEEAVVAAMNAVRGYVAAHPDAYPQSFAVARMIEETPSLKARANEKYLVWEDHLLAGLTARGIAPLLARMAAVVAVGGQRVAVAAWVASGPAEALPVLLDEAYSSLSLLASPN